MYYVEEGGVIPLYKILICDDNEEYLSEFKEVICKVPEYNPDIMELYAFRSGEEFLKEKLEEFQLVFRYANG